MDDHSRLKGDCPDVQINMGGVVVPCLLDTGSMVTTIRESFFEKHFRSQGIGLLKKCHWLRLRAANGLKIPYLGYMELDVTVLGKTLSQMGVLVVRDPLDELTRQQPVVSGLLGMNIIRHCYHLLFEQYGSRLFESPVLQAASKEWKETLSMCHRIEALNTQGCLAIAKVHGSLKWIRTSCPCTLNTTLPSVLLEPLAKGNPFPAGALVSAAFFLSTRTRLTFL